MISSYIGFLVGVMFIVGYVPQIRELFRGATQKDGLKGVSSIFWFFIFFGVYITFRNLEFTNSHLGVVIPQGLNAYFAMFIFMAVVMLKNDFTKSVIIVIGSLMIVNAGIVFLPTDWSQNFATAFISIAYITQIVKLVKSKNTNGLSISLFVFIAISLLLMVVNIVLSGSYILAGWTEMTNMLLILIIICLILYYRKTEKV